MGTLQTTKSKILASLKMMMLCGVLLFSGDFLVSFSSHIATKSVYAASDDHTNLRLLKEVVPGADSFSEKEGEPPVYKAYRTDEATGEKILIGYAVVTPDVPPERNGFSGTIDTLIGINLEGTITGLKVVYYKESYRYTLGDFFSWGFEGQYIGKTVRDRLSVGRDIDGIAKATISSKAAAWGIRQTIRAVTEAYLD